MLHLPPIEQRQSWTFRTWGFILSIFAYLALSALAGAVLWIAPHFVRRPGGGLTACKSNLKNMATILEMYASDFGGHYPQRLACMVPVYLKQIPTCPAAQHETYTYQSRQKPDSFSLTCAGDNHHDFYARIFPGKSSHNYPSYSAERGFADHP